MDTRDVLRGSLAFAHQLAEGIVDGLDDKALYAVPDTATVNSIAATYVHAVHTEDSLVSSMVRQAPTLYQASGWAGKTRTALEGPRMTAEWARSLRLDFPAYREYAQAVYAQTDATIAGLSDAELDREFEFGGLGKTTVAGLCGGLLVYHIASHGGEIAALKGVQGTQGLPY